MQRNLSGCAQVATVNTLWTQVMLECQQTDTKAGATGEWWDVWNACILDISVVSFSGSLLE